MWEASLLAMLALRIASKLAPTPALLVRLPVSHCSRRMLVGTTRGRLHDAIPRFW